MSACRGLNKKSVAESTVRGIDEVVAHKLQNHKPIISNHTGKSGFSANRLGGPNMVGSESKFSLVRETDKKPEIRWLWRKLLLTKLQQQELSDHNRISVIATSVKRLLQQLYW
ncbi:hypothetical protein QE152_g8433 [Popillia japonica]|uniref:Uncharacterized protein n=1 Tax=Popillia japonica TaxID=7064 RepID=A0AAW1MBY1_POPJA